jgi:predicted DNA-binding protein
MSPSEAQKKAAAKYHKENIASLACRVKKEQAEKYKAYCEAQGKTSNAVLREFVMSCIDEKDGAAE